MTPREAKRCLALLARYLHCDDRANAADARGRRHPGTYTMDKEFALSSRWDEKAQAAWNEAIEIIARYADPDAQPADAEAA